MHDDNARVIRKLSTYIAGALRRPLPAEVVARGKLHLLDTLAAIVSGSRLIPGTCAIRYVKTLGGTQEASIAGTRIVTTAVNAALANGVCAHADATDDSHRASSTHPGAGAVPAALAMAERHRAGGTALLRAVVLGYDVGTRLTMSLDLQAFYARGHHPPCFGGLFAAAAAAGALARLDVERVRYLLSYTAQQASGLSSLFRDPAHVEKAFAMGGMPAHNGVQAALLAAHGCTGVADVFSGARNFFFAFSPDATPGKLVEGLGDTYEVMHTSIKKFPVGGPILAPLDAVQHIQRRHGFDASDVEKVVVKLRPDRVAIANDRTMPDINLQHMVAVMLLDGNVTFRSAHDFARLRDPRTARLRQRVELVGAPELADDPTDWNARVEVRLRDGRTLEHHTPAARGGHGNPMTQEEEDAKARDLLAPVLGSKRARQVIDTVWNVEKLQDARALGKLLRV
jgi:2-methylcitrate dehydratase PrpD